MLGQDECILDMGTYESFGYGGQGTDNSREGMGPKPRNAGDL